MPNPKYYAEPVLTNTYDSTSGSGSTEVLYQYQHFKINVRASSNVLINQIYIIDVYLINPSSWTYFYVDYYTRTGLSIHKVLSNFCYIDLPDQYEANINFLSKVKEATHTLNR